MCPACRFRGRPERYRAAPAVALTRAAETREVLPRLRTRAARAGSDSTFPPIIGRRGCARRRVHLCTTPPLSSGCYVLCFDVFECLRGFWNYVGVRPNAIASAAEKERVHCSLPRRLPNVSCGCRVWEWAFPRAERDFRLLSPSVLIFRAHHLVPAAGVSYQRVLAGCQTQSYRSTRGRTTK